MSKIIAQYSLGLLAIAALFAPLTARASDPGTGNISYPQPRQMAEQFHFTTYDSDRSGSLDMKEYGRMSKDGFASNSFEQLDVNGDGKLSLAELEGIESQRMAGSN